MNTAKHKALTIRSINTLGEGSYTFFGDLHGIPLLFEQWDNGPIELNLDELHKTLGNGVQMLPQKFFDFLVKLAAPEIERVKYQVKLINAFSEN